MHIKIMLTTNRKFSADDSELDASNVGDMMLQVGDRRVRTVADVSPEEWGGSLFIAPYGKSRSPIQSSTVRARRLLTRD